MGTTTERTIIIAAEDFASRMPLTGANLFTDPRSVAEGPQCPYKGLVIDGKPVVGDAVTHLGLLALYAHHGEAVIDESAVVHESLRRDLSLGLHVTAACDIRADGSILRWSSDGLKLETPEGDRAGLAPRVAEAVAELNQRRALLAQADLNVREGGDPFSTVAYAMGIPMSQLGEVYGMGLMNQLGEDNAQEVFGERKSFRFLLLKDGTFLFGRYAYHCYLLHAFDHSGGDGYDAAVTAARAQSDYEQVHAHRVLGCGEVSLEGEVLSWISTGFKVETPYSFRDHILRSIRSAMDLLRLIPGEVPRPVLAYLALDVIPRLSTDTATTIYMKLKVAYKFLVLTDGTVLLGDQRWHRYLLALHDHWDEADADFEPSIAEVPLSIEQYDEEHAHRIAAAGEADEDGNVTSWVSTGFKVETPAFDRTWIAESIARAISLIPPVPPE